MLEMGDLKLSFSWGRTSICYSCFIKLFEEYEAIQTLEKKKKILNWSRNVARVENLRYFMILRICWKKTLTLIFKFNFVSMAAILILKQSFKVVCFGFHNAINISPYSIKKTFVLASSPNLRIHDKSPSGESSLCALKHIGDVFVKSLVYPPAP